MCDAVNAVKGGLVVSCQAPPGHPFAGVDATVLLARCAALGGAVGLRIDSAAGVRAVKAEVTVPVIGIHKVRAAGRPRITTEFRHAAQLAEAGADIIALETSEESGPRALDLLARVRRELGVAVMADVATADEGKLASEAGADLVGTTLSGYTANTANGDEDPDLDLVATLAAAGIRTVAEGRIRYPHHATEAIERGAWCVVVGTAITDPAQLTAWFAGAIGAAAGRDPR